MCCQVARLLALVPPWVRVYRIQRDIPMPLVTSGVEKGNLRELALARMGQLGLRCRDVRTREVGIQVCTSPPTAGLTCLFHPLLKENCGIGIQVCPASHCRLTCLPFGAWRILWDLLAAPLR
jgi:hypothetical protein